MTNRNMQAKSNKAKKQRRLFPRHLSADYIPTGKPPNMLVMKDLKERARSLAFDDEYADYLVRREQLKGMFPHPGREEVEAHIKRIKEVAPSLQCVTICDSIVCKTKLFYNEKHDRFVLFEDNITAGTVRTSMVYMDRKRCIAAWKTDITRWVYFSSVRPPTPCKSE